MCADMETHYLEPRTGSAEMILKAIVQAQVAPTSPKFNHAGIAGTSSHNHGKALCTMLARVATSTAISAPRRIKSM